MLKFDNCLPSLHQKLFSTVAQKCDSNFKFIHGSVKFTVAILISLNAILIDHFRHGSKTYRAKTKEIKPPCLFISFVVSSRPRYQAEF